MLNKKSLGINRILIRQFIIKNEFKLKILEKSQQDNEVKRVKDKTRNNKKHKKKTVIIVNS